MVRVDGVGVVDDVVVVRLRPRWQGRWRCRDCDRRCPVYDTPAPRRWRGLDVGRQRLFIESTVPRVHCADHGVRVAAVPWARPAARHTFGFEQLAAWCAVQMSASAASELLRCSWRTIGGIVTRVVADLERQHGDGLDGLHRIGIDEVSYRRHHRYLLVVVDHDRRRLVFATPGATGAAVDSFFDALGPERAALLTHVSTDGAPYLIKTLARRAPKVTVCADPFHVVRWAMDALDDVRRATWNKVRVHLPRKAHARGPGVNVKAARFALWKNPERHTDRDRAHLAFIAATHPDLHRAWALKEGLRVVFQSSGEPAITELKRWLAWAQRSRLAPFVELAKRIRSFWGPIVASLTDGINNALVEAINTRIRLINRRAYGFRNVNALIALIKLSLGTNRPVLPT